MLTQYQQELAGQLLHRAEHLTGIPIHVFNSSHRGRDNVNIRTAISMALLNNGWTLKEVGSILSDKHHSSIINARKKFNNLLFEVKQTGEKNELIELVYILTKYVESSPFNTNRDTRHMRINKLQSMIRNGSSIYSIVGSV